MPGAAKVRSARETPWRETGPFSVAARAHSTEHAAMAGGIILVLGSPNDEHGALHSVAVERCQAALRIHRANPGWHVLLTGGFGAHFNTTNRPHAHYLQAWLMANGIPPAAFLPSAESRNTLEDASLSRPIALAAGAGFAVVVTSDYHLDRARFVFEREFRGSGILLAFLGTHTDEAACRLDLAALRAHETAALARLRAAG